MPSLLTLPAELRNQIYDLLFIETCPYTRTAHDPDTSPCLADFGRPSNLDETTATPAQPLILACRQIHTETQLLHLQRTSFIIGGPYADPEDFKRLCTTNISPLLAKQIRHITLVGRINRLRALNESWNGIPFGCRHLSLETLVLVPRRPAQYDRHYAEIADLDSAQTLSYTLSETLKNLHNVKRVIVRNEDECFNAAVWKVVYRNLISRLLRWGGKLCSCRFREGDGWFEVLVDGRNADPVVYRDADTEFQRVIGR
jgi:ferredoxin-thioredoxin reductase catalytic subunit